SSRNWGSKSREGCELWLVGHHCQAALSDSEIYSRSHDRRMGLGHSHSHGGAEYCHAADALPDDEVITQDATHSAADGRDQSEVLEVQDYRSAPAGDEQRDLRSPEARRCEHVRRLYSDAHPVAAALRVLSHALQRHRTAAGALAVAARSVGS